MQVLSHGNVRHASETTAIRAVHRGERYRLRNFVSPCRAGRGCTPRSWVSPCRGGIRRKQRSSLSASREGRGCTPRSRISPCREGRACTPRTCFAASREGSRCTPRTCVSACREGRGCTPSSCFSPCRGGRGCTPRSSFSPCHGRTRRTPRSYLSASRVAALHFQCDKRECENGHSARVYRLIAALRRCGGWREISDNDKIAFAATMNKTKIFTTIESLPNALGAPRFTPSRRGLQCRFASALRGSGCERVQTHAFRAMSAVAGVTAVVSADNCKRSTFSRRRNATPAVAFPSSPGRLTGDARFPPGSVSSTRGYRSSSRNALFASNKPRSGVPGDVSVSRDESDRLSLDNIRASLIRQEGGGLSHSPHSASLNAYTRLTLSC